MASSEKTEIPVSQALEHRYGRPEIEEVEASFRRKNFVLRMLRERNEEARRGRLASFAGKVAVWNNVRLGVKRREGDLDKRGESIKEFARAEGVRGVELVSDGYSVSIHPRVEIDYDREGLQEALGPAYSSVVTEESSAVFTGMSPEEVDRLLRAGHLVIFGHSDEDDYRKRVIQGIVLKVDEEKLYEMHMDEQVDADLAGSATESWVMRPTPIQQPQETNG